jgi:hypothetical protein
MARMWEMMTERAGGPQQAFATAAELGCGKKSREGLRWDYQLILLTPTEYAITRFEGRVSSAAGTLS